MRRICQICCNCSQPGVWPISGPGP